MNLLVVIDFPWAVRLRMVIQYGCLVLFLALGLSVAAQEEVFPAPPDPLDAALGLLTEGKISEAEVQAENIADPAAKLYVQACIERAKGDPKRAIRTVTKLIARYPNNPDWTAKSELMSALLYIELGMTNAALVTARQMQLLHEGTEEAKQAASISINIEKMKKELESEGSTE